MNPDAANLQPPEFVDAVLRHALAVGASDIYWLPGRERLAVRLKVSGVQQAVTEVPAAYGAQCVARLKVLGGLLTYRTSVAQDGAVRDAAGLPPGAELRIAVMPTRLGERITVRVLDRRQVPLDLERLGYSETLLRSLRELLARPGGMLILTGPTGCGKTTTVYALLRELLRTGHDPASIITVEDPVECEIEGISQVQLTRAEAGWDYAAALRAALRQDVKTLMIGEMRDREVVRVALDAALTGHRILTTYHAGDIPSVYARLLHQGFEPFLIAAAVTGVLSQRLVPRRDGAGQMPVAAVLTATDAWRDVVVANPGLSELRKRAAAIPGADLAAAARDLAAQGMIEEKEVWRL